MGTREEVLTILQSAEASRIRFSFRSIAGLPVSVDHTTFLRVVAAIESNRIRIESERLAASRGGEYNDEPANGGVLNLRPIRNRRYLRSAVIHEAVHASFDLTRSVISAVDDEVAAYLANTLYLRQVHLPLERLGTRRPGTRRLYESLWRAAASIERNGAATDSQIEQIRIRLIEHPLYNSLLLTAGCSEEGQPCFYEVRAYNG